MSIDRSCGKFCCARPSTTSVIYEWPWRACC